MSEMSDQYIRKGYCAYCGKRTIKAGQPRGEKRRMNTGPTQTPPGVDPHHLVRLLEMLAQKFVWVAPVGNDDSYNERDENGVWRPVPNPLGFMVCKRSVNNVDGKNTRVDFLRVDSSSVYRWKKPFRQCECMFPTMESAIIAAGDVEGIIEPHS